MIIMSWRWLLHSCQWSSEQLTYKMSTMWQRRWRRPCQCWSNFTGRWTSLAMNLMSIGPNWKTKPTRAWELLLEPDLQTCIIRKITCNCRQWQCWRPHSERYGPLVCAHNFTTLLTPNKNDVSCSRVSSLAKLLCNFLHFVLAVNFSIAVDSGKFPRTSHYILPAFLHFHLDFLFKIWIWSHGSNVDTSAAAEMTIFTNVFEPQPTAMMTCFRSHLTCVYFIFKCNTSRNYYMLRLDSLTSAPPVSIACWLRSQIVCGWSSIHTSNLGIHSSRSCLVSTNSKFLRGVRVKHRYPNTFECGTPSQQMR